jgi:hypothetical protein
MGLRDNGDAVVLQPLDQVHLPQGAIVIKRPAEQPCSELIELLATTWPGNGGTSHVMLEIELLVVDPDRPGDTKWDLAHMLAVPGDHGDSGRDAGQ